MRTQSVGRDLYLKTTEANGKTHISQHRVWDAQRFVASQQEMHDKADEGKPDGARVSITDRTEYLRSNAK